MRIQLSGVLPVCLLALAACEVKVVDGSDAGKAKPDGSVADAGKKDSGHDDDDAGSGGATHALDCTDRDKTPTTTVTTTVSADATWSGVVMLQGAIEVHEPATLTIKPGTLVVMDSDSSLTVGWNSGAAKISAEGTETAPIRFCGKRPEAGYYKQISIESNVKTDSALKHVLVADGGGDSAALVVNAGIAVEDVRVENSGADGVAARSWKRGSARLSVVGSAKYAVSLGSQTAVHNFPGGGTFTGNHDNVIRLDFDSIDADTTFASQGIPYRQAKSIDIKAGEIHLAAGVEYQLTADAALDVGWNSTAPSFFVDGTEAKPVTLRGVEATSGYWAGVKIERNVRSESKLHYLKLMHGGGSAQAPLEVWSNITLDHVSLDKNAAAARIRASLASGSSALMITGSDGSPLETDLESAITLPADSKLAGNHTDFVEIVGSDYGASGTLHRLDVPYRVKESIDLKENSALTIDPGSILVMTADTALTFGWNSGSMTVTAKGSADKPIVFRGDSDTKGYWNGIVVERNTRTESAFDHVQIANAGKLGGAAFTSSANVPLTNSEITKSAGYGVLADIALTINYDTGNIFSDVAQTFVFKR